VRRHRRHYETRRPVCFPVGQLLRHDRAVANGKMDGTGPWLRMSGWLPPGLALGALAVLATFIHGVGRLLTAWAATVSLIVLLARRRPAAGSSSPSKTAAPNPPTTPDTRPMPPSGEEGTTRSTALSAGMTEKAATSAAHSPGLTSEPGSRAKPVLAENAPRPAPDATVSDAADQAEQLSAAETVADSGLRILTAAEVASMLRVDANVIITAISDGELPGNRVGGHWRVEQGALTRWLRGTYGGHADPAGPSYPTGQVTDPT
jgi:excisionase family DNA binding protein